MKECPKCKAQNPDGNTFCMRCGSNLPQQPIRPNPQGAGYGNPNMQNSVQPAQKNNLVPILITVVVVVAIIVAGIVAIVIVKSDNKAETTQAMSTAVLTTETTTETTTKETTTKETTTKATTEAKTEAPTVINNYNYYYHDYEGYRYSDDGFLYPSDTEYITYSYLDGVGREETRLILNEMYARHGYIFKEKQYKDYFNSKSWYVPAFNDMADAQSTFNSIEKANLNTIVAYEKDMGWR